MPRILVADDNTNIQKMVALAFQDRGIDVISVGNGEAAVRRIPDLHPDLILADIFMPVRNGYELCEWVKKDSKFSQIPVILLVGAFDPLDEKEARRVAADGVLKKPFIPPDPLIAMVTSVLERNPAIAEELARAKEKKQAVPPPPPVPEPVEIPAKVAPKTLPEFPEPSSEEAELVYSFGTGRRALDNEEDSPDEHPVPKAKENDETEEEFDTAATANDWRRSAMQFEVPEEASLRPAISSDEDLDQFFPTEAEFTAKNIHASDSAALIEPLMQDDQDHPPAQPASSSAAVTPSQTPVVESVSVPEPEPEPTMQGTQQTGSALDETPKEEHGEVTPEPSFASKATHWMDLMASPSGRPSSDWFSSVLSAVESVDLPELTSASSAASELPSTPPQMAEEPVADAAAEQLTEAQAAPVEVASAPSAQEESSFADEPEESEPVTLSFAGTLASEPPSIESLRQREVEPAEEPVTEAVAEPASAVVGEPASQIVEEEMPEMGVHALSEPDNEFIVEAPEPESLYKEPDLVEPPGVRVTPEPLLVDESAVSGPSRYDKHSETVPPLYSLALPSQQEPAAQEPASEEIPAQDPSESGPLEFSSADFSERIPTVEPPNREALADIPFLNPPADFRQSAAPPEQARPAEVDSAAVDAIVQKLFEKIEPQLHDLLSQGVLKPLVQSLLQNELEKKEK